MKDLENGEHHFPALPIDVATWQEDEEWAAYPEGARPKSAHFPPQGPLPTFINPARRYLFKRSVNRYPDQFWAEIVAYHIGRQMRIVVPPAYPAINSLTNQCGALIEWFYEDGKELYVMGGQYMQKLIPHFDRKKGTQHNFHSIRVLFRALQKAGLAQGDWLDGWIRTFLFDAICGNTDRHQDNWGFLVDPTRNRPEFLLSPCYDNGTSLGHELFEKHWREWRPEQWKRYVDRGCPHMKWALESPGRERHVDFLKKIGGLSPTGLKQAVALHLANFDTVVLRDTLTGLSAIEMTIALAPWRADLICRLVELRRNQLLEALA